jgi:hypothetical protein
MNHHRPAHSGKLATAMLGTSGLLLMSLGVVLVALQFQSQRLNSSSPWQFLEFLARVTTGLQLAEILGWATVTGLLISLGVGTSALTRGRAVAILAAAPLSQ